MHKILIKVEYYITRGIEIILGIMFMTIFIMVFYQIVLRYVFNTSIFGTAEVYIMLFAYCSSMGAAVMLRKREHIRIDMLVTLLPRKVAKIVVTIGYLLIAVLCLYIAKESISWLNSVKTFRSPVTGISRLVESITIPISFFLTVFYSVLNILDIYLNPEEAEQEFSPPKILVNE